MSFHVLVPDSGIVKPLRFVSTLATSKLGCAEVEHLILNNSPPPGICTSHKYDLAVGPLPIISSAVIAIESP